MLGEYAPLLVLFGLTLGLGLAILGIAAYVGPRRPSPVKRETYESGMTAIGPGQRRMPARFYLVATLFILFDIEAIYLYPWAVVFRDLARPAPDGQGLAALGGVAVFVGVLALGLVHAWRRGALEWD